MSIQNLKCVRNKDEIKLKSKLRDPCRFKKKLSTTIYIAKLMKSTSFHFLTSGFFKMVQEIL